MFCILLSPDTWMSGCRTLLPLAASRTKPKLVGWGNLARRRTLYSWSGSFSHTCLPGTIQHCCLHVPGQHITLTDVWTSRFWTCCSNLSITAETFCRSMELRALSKAFVTWAMFFVTCWNRTMLLKNRPLLQSRSQYWKGNSSVTFQRQGDRRWGEMKAGTRATEVLSTPKTGPPRLGPTACWSWKSGYMKIHNPQIKWEARIQAAVSRSWEIYEHNGKERESHIKKLIN